MTNLGGQSGDWPHHDKVGIRPVGIYLLVRKGAGKKDWLQLSCFYYCCENIENGERILIARNSFSLTLTKQINQPPNILNLFKLSNFELWNNLRSCHSIYDIFWIIVYNQ